MSSTPAKARQSDASRPGIYRPPHYALTLTGSTQPQFAATTIKIDHV